MAGADTDTFMLPVKPRPKAWRAWLDFFDYVEAIQGMSSRAQVVRALERVLANYGVEYFVFVKPAANKREFQDGILAGRLHEDWMRTFYARGYADNNQILTGRYGNTGPVYWTDVLAAGDGDRRFPAMYRSAQDFDLNEGFCVPLSMPQRSLATAVFAGREIEKTHIAGVSLHGVALYTFYRLSRMDAPGGKTAVRLTKREADCLCWVARGKSDWEIGEILSIGESTVHSYIESAKRKLGVSTRIQAVVHALQDGLIAI